MALILVKIPIIQQELSVMKDGKKSVFNDDEMPINIANINSST